MSNQFITDTQERPQNPKFVRRYIEGMLTQMNSEILAGLDMACI